MIPWNPRHRRSQKNLTLNDVIPDWDAGDGIFSHIDTSMPWSQSVSAVGLDIAYHGQRSGDKFISSMMYRWLDDDGVLTATGFDKLKTALTARYMQKWSHLWTLYTTEYSPLNTYSLTEEYESTRTPDLSIRDVGQSTESSTEERTPDLTTTDTSSETDSSTNQRTPNLTATTTEDKSSTGSETKTPNLTTRTVTDQDDTSSGQSSTSTQHGHVVTTVGQSSSEGDDKVFGFNSATAVPSTEAATSSDSTTTETNSGTDTTSGTTSGTATRDVTETETRSGTESSSSSTSEDNSSTTTQTGTETTTISDTKSGTNTRTETGTDTTEVQSTGNTTNTRTETGTETEEFTRTKTGNMYRSPAELLDFDRNFWLTDFFEIVFKDVDDMLTLAIYSESPINTKVY